MIVAALYALTALVTGLHNVYLLMNVVNGAPINLLNCIALFGSMVLLVAALLTHFRPRLAAKAGLVGAVLLWVFYLPMVVIWLSMPLSAWQEIRNLLSFREYVPLAGTLLGPLLLIVCNVVDIRAVKANA